MRQISLLDSFIKRQKDSKNQSSAKKEGKEQNDKNDSEEPNDRFAFKRNKLTIDSDQEKQIIETVKVCVEELDVNDENYDGNGKIQQSKKKNQNDSAKGLKNVEKRINSTPKVENDDDDPLSQFSDATPIWAQKEHCKDKQLRSPNDSNYDPTTLHIPTEAWGKMTAPMKQFWRIKSENFDKVILFKLGKFYELFYEDAAIGNRHLDLKFMGTKMHTGFPEKCLQKYTTELVQLGFKTVVVEQMETPQQMQNRVKANKSIGQNSDKTLNREVTQILTKGTLSNIEQNENAYLPNFLISLRAFGESYAFSLLQIGTNEIAMGSVKGLEKLKTVLYQTRPAELVYDPDNLSFELCRMMEKTFLQMQMSKVYNNNNLWHPLNAIGQIERLTKESGIAKPKIFDIIEKMQEFDKQLLLATLSGMFSYLRKVLKFEYVIGSVRFTFYQKDSHSKSMILDSQALQHLQIFETSEGTERSLFNIIDHTKTNFGKRLLRKWLMCPLMSEFHINQRLNAVEDIEGVRLEKQRVCNLLKELPDLEKKINKLYHYAVRTTSASKAVYFEDLNKSRLKEFKETMEKVELAWNAITVLRNCIGKFKSIRLRQLLTIGGQPTQSGNDVYNEDEDDQSGLEGLLPNVIAYLQQFKTYVKWENGIPVPQKGLVEYFDSLQTEIDSVKAELQSFLDKVRYQMNEPNLKFVHTKERFEIEIPERSEKKRPTTFEFSSKRAGFSRYVCKETKSIVKKLEKVEQEAKSQMGLFVGFFFEEFKKKQKIWQRFVEIIAEIDCLISLSEYSQLGGKVRPKFVESGFEIKGARHPCLTNIEFIPNDVKLQPKVMLLTGPNMGGKSTILRTVCCLTVLAQIGCFVPCDEYRCQTVDRIFTRIGASDRLELGKSTFFIEMEQTKTILANGTAKSLAIIDQLGRGTATFDGLAIAYSVLKSIIQNVQCYCLFATHYHILIDEFRSLSTVQLMMMDCLLRNDEIIFLFKLVKGSVARSFGLSIADRVGIGKRIIGIAEVEAQKMNNYIEGKRNALNQVLQFVYRVN